MAIPYALIWACIKLVISDKTVNTAIDHWTNGTSTKLDDMLWKVLELAAGIKDHDLKVLTLNAGVADITARYDSAKKEGREAKFKEPTIPPVSPEEMRIIMAGELRSTGNIG